jgi:hypothetical protein
MRHVSNRDLGYAWLDATGAVALSGDGTTGAIAQYGGIIQFVREVSVPALTSANPKFEAPLFTWSRPLRRTPFPNPPTSALWIREVDIIAGAAYCSGPPPTSPSGSGVHLRLTTSAPGLPQNIFSWTSVISGWVGPASRRFGPPVSSLDAALLKDQDRMTLSFSVELTLPTPNTNPGVYRVVVLAMEV